jgi:hypothetical protein
LWCATVSAFCRPAGGTQQPGDPFPGVPLALGAEFGMHAWRTVGALRLLVHLDDLLGQARVLSLAGGGTSGVWA